MFSSPNTRGETSTMTSNPSECAYSLISVNSFFISSAGLFTDSKHEKILEKPHSLVFFRYLLISSRVLFSG